MQIKKILRPAIFFLIVMFVVFFYAASVQAQSGSLNGVEIPGDTGLPDPSGGIKQIIKNLLIWLLEIVGIVALISFAIAGIQYFMAAGDDKSMSTAKQNMQYSILGVIVALSGVVIIKAVEAILKANPSF
jgi:hypothetical protein